MPFVQVPRDAVAGRLGPVPQPTLRLYRADGQRQECGLYQRLADPRMVGGLGLERGELQGGTRSAHLRPTALFLITVGRLLEARWSTLPLGRPP